jgi:parvulin-like peptidyl-prolyl isomerase
MALAIELKARLNENPAQFQRLLAEYSDDETKVTTFGRIKEVKKGQMVDSFEEAAFALETPGDISEPVSTIYGVHLIRLDAKNSEGIPPFEAVRQEAIDKQVKRYEERYLRQYLSKLFKDPVVFPEGSVEIMAKRHFGENLEKAPVFKESDTE